jgi:hypothetical protein
MEYKLAYGSSINSKHGARIDLEERVQLMTGQGFELYGSPFSCDDTLYQAMTRKTAAAHEETPAPVLL